MKNRKNNYIIISFLTALALIISLSCEREMDGMIPAEFPSDGDIFVDGFTAGLAYEAWGDVTAFDVDTEVKYKGESSMRFAVPDAGETGGFAGGRFVTSIPRNLSDYDALTFWAKASKAASIDVVGFGNNAEGSKYQASLIGMKVNTNWKKIIVPIPDPSKLTTESGMLYYTEAPEEGSGYTFWFDEVKFEKLGTIAHQKPAIINGEDKVSTAFNGISIPIAGFSYVANLPNGVNQNVEVASSYFTFTSSENNVATVDENGIVTVLSSGTAVVTAKMADLEAEGSLTVESSGDFIHAPNPTIHPDSTISIFSNPYTNVPVEYYNGYWQPFQTTLSADFTVDGDDVLNYTNFNFVGIQFSSPTVNGSEMTHLHLDVFVPNDVSPADKLEIRLVDLGPDGSFDDPNPSISYTIEGADMVAQSWISVDIDLAGLSSKSRLAQIIFDNGGSALSGFYVDNIYLYNDGGLGGTDPTEAAPDPVHDEANVISIYSDAYTSLEGTDFPDWGQNTVVSDVIIDGNNTLKLAGLDYQGIQLASSLDASGMEYLHIDYWSENSAALNSFLISSGPVEKANAMIVPTTGWMSVDIPLSDFSPVDLADIVQMKFDGNGDIYMDNIYFHKKGRGTGSMPTEAAPTPNQDAANVVSVYSDEYTDISGTDYNPGWGQTTVYSEVPIAGNNTMRYASFDYQGIDFSTNKFDATEMTNFHMDIWTPNEVLDKVFTIKCVDFGGGTEEATNFILTITHTTNGNLPALATGSWISIDVPIADFSGDLTKTDLAQIVTSGSLSDVFIDNIYFYKNSSGNTECTGETVQSLNAADLNLTFMSDPAASIIEDGGDFEWIDNPDFDNPVNSSCKVGKITKLGNNPWDNNQIDLDAKLDFNTNTGLKIKVWSSRANTEVRIKLEEIGNAGNNAEQFTTTTVTGGWEELTFPFTSDDSDKFNKIVIFFDLNAGNTDTYYFDDLMLYGTGVGTGGDCTPPEGDLISNGGFETGNTDCWLFFDNGGKTEVTNTENNGGTYSAKITTAPQKNPGIKHERFGVGTVQANQKLEVKLDSKVESLVDGAVVNVLAFSESSTEGVAAVLHNLGTINVTPGSWNANTLSFTTAADVSGGISLLLEVVCGGAETCSGVVYFDNVSVKIAN